MGESIDPYLARLIENVEGRKFQEASLVERVQFVGTPPDFEFAASMMACDVNVFPYQDVGGQSASAAAGLSIELGTPTIVSNSPIFSELARYFQGRLILVDVGNHLQLAQRIKEVAGRTLEYLPKLEYGRFTQAEFYGQILEMVDTRDR